jgi:hypothetical protein
LKNLFYALCFAAAACLAGCSAFPSLPAVGPIPPVVTPYSSIHKPPVYKKVAAPAVTIVPAVKPEIAHNAGHVVDIVRQAPLHALPVIEAVDHASAIVRGDITSAVTKVEEGHIAASWREGKTNAEYVLIAVAVIFTVAGAALIGERIKRGRPASLPHIEIAPLVEKAKVDAKAEEARISALAKTVATGHLWQKFANPIKDAWQETEGYLQHEIAEVKAAYDEHVAKPVDEAKDAADLDAMPGYVLDNPAAVQNLIAGDTVPAVEVAAAPGYIQDAAAPVETDLTTGQALAPVVEAVELSLNEQLAKAKDECLKFTYGTPEYNEAFKRLSDLAGRVASLAA